MPLKNLVLLELWHGTKIKLCYEIEFAIWLQGEASFFHLPSVLLVTIRQCDPTQPAAQIQCSSLSKLPFCLICLTFKHHNVLNEAYHVRYRALMCCCCEYWMNVIKNIPIWFAAAAVVKHLSREDNVKSNDKRSQWSQRLNILL